LKPISAHRSVERWRGECVEPVEDDIAEEVPVALEYNGTSHAVMLATPADLEDFALGFSLTEGILKDASQLKRIMIIDAAEGIRVAMEIDDAAFSSYVFSSRNMTGRTGCGLCGVETLDRAIRRPDPVPDHFRMGSKALHRALEAMPGHQLLQMTTGATHAAAWVSRDGEVICLKEDVGRHNALDKLIGSLASTGTDFSEGAVLVTSRASYEMVQKAATVGIEFMAAVSAPTNLARDLAEGAGMTLIGFARRGGHTVYSNHHRLDQHGH
jgi:FdhD protein